MKLLIVCLLVAGALAVPVKKSKKEIFKCEEERNRFKEGVRYSYKYEGEVSSGIVGLSEDRTGLKLKCNVQVEVPESCELQLRTEGCVLEELVRPGQYQKAPNSRQFSLAMSERPLYFRMTRGEVYGVYPSIDEPLQILNIKKGILSSLQVQKVEEPARVHQSRNTTVNVTDIHGNCSANYTVYKLKQGRTVYNVSRDLNNCTRPNKTITELSPLSLIKNISKQVENNMNSTQNCSYEIDRKGQIREVYCLEQYTVLPLSSNQSRQGVQTNITVVLKKGSTETMNSKKIDTSLEGRRVCNLTFEYENVTVPSNSSINVTLDILMQLVNTTKNTTQLNSTVLFDRFVASLRSLKNESLFDLFPVVYLNKTGNFSCNSTQQMARDYLVQALPQCGSVPCISLISHAIMNGTINGTTADLLLYSLAFITEPTLPIINETLKVAKLNRTRPALLSLSTQVYNFYQKNQTAREEREIPQCIRESMDMLLNTISFDCSPLTNLANNPRVAIKEQEDILIALRAIGNMGFPVQKLDKELRKDFRIVPTLVRCAKNPAVPRNVSLAAIQAVRRMEFTPEVRQELTTLVSEPAQDVEQRIAAYVMLMKNVTKPDLVSILRTLQREQVKQVRSFISSHLVNIRRSEEPIVRPLRQLVEETVREERIVLPEQEEEAMKFSKNYQYDQELYVPYTNISWINRLKTNVVYHPESPLPRQVALNYTLEALGMPVNLFDLTFDMEGLETVVESIFGQKGYYPDQTLKTILKKKSQPKKSPLTNNVLETLEDLHKEVRQERAYPQVSSTLRILGNEFGFVTLEQIKNMTIGSKNPIEFFDILSRGIEKNFTAAWKFVEARHTVPTIIGMPLNVTTNGTLVARASVNITADLKKIFTQPRSAYIKTVVVPSATVSIVSRMTVDCPLYSTVGLQMNDTLYHSSNISANVTLKNGELSFHLNNSAGPVQVMNYSRELYLIRPRENITEIRVPRTNSTSFKNCTNTTNVLGVELCFSGEIVNGTYRNVSHLVGPVKSLNVTIVPTDKNLTTYSVAMKYEQIRQSIKQEKPRKQLWRTRFSKDPSLFNFIESLRVNFSAPGQNYTRNVTSLLQLNRNTTELLWNITVPEVQNITVWAKIANESQWWNRTMNYTMLMNVTYAPEKNLTLEWRYLNVTCNRTQTQNYTMVANMTVSNMTYAWSSSVNRTLNSTGNFTANVNVTYYWDPVTPILDWLKPEYQVKPENISVLALNYAYLNKSSNNETVWESQMNLTYPFQNITFLARVWNNTANYSASANLTWLTPANETRFINVSHQLLNSSIDSLTNFTYVFNISSVERFLCINASFINTTQEYNSTLNVTLFSLNTTMYNMSFYNWTAALSMRNVSQESPEPSTIKWYYEPTSGKYVRKPQPDVWQVKLNLTYPSWFNQSSQNFTLSARLVNATHDHGRNYTMISNISVPEFRINATHNMTLINKTQGIEFFWNTTACANLTLLQNVTIFNTSLWNITRLNRTSPYQLQNATWTGKLNYTWPRNETIQIPLPVIGNLSLSNVSSLFENITMPVYLASYKLPFQIFGIESIPWLRQVNESMIVRLLNISYFEPKFLEELEPIVGKIEIPLPKMQIIPRPILRLINYTLPNMTIPKNLSLPCLGNLTYEMNLTSPIYNVTVNSTVQNVTVARNVSVLNAFVNVTSNCSMEFLNFTMQGVLNATHLNNLTEVNVTSGLNLTHPDLTVNVTLNTTCLNITGMNVTNLNSTFLVNITAPQWMNVTFNVTARNDTLYANLTVPTFNSSIVLLGQLPNKTRLNVTLYVKNITRDINETVLSWYVTLNETSLLYSNLTWNLTALNSTMNLTRAVEQFWNITGNTTHPINKYAVQYLNKTVAECLNTTVNYTMTLVNSTVNYTYELVQNLTVGTPLFNVTFNGTDMIRNITNMITYNTTEFFNRTLPAWMTNFYKYEPITQMIVNYTINATIPQNLTITNASINALSYFLFSGYQYSNNSICINITHPMNWTSFYELPKPRNETAIRNRTYTESIVTYFYDMIFKKPIKMYTYTTKTGMIFGKNHVYTFDGRMYAVPEYKNEDCMYILARDFLDKNFTILSSPESITIKLRELVVKIKGDSKVYIDGVNQPTELPYQTPEKNVTITRTGVFVNVTTRYGISVICDSVNQLCAFNISGMYHNKTLGLLGTSDNEPSTDFRRPDGTNTSNVAVFLNSFEVTGFKTCKLNPREQYNKVAKVKLSKVSPICRQLLDERNTSSPYAKCFKTVDPKPFREACEYDSKYQGQQTAYCSTIGAYVNLCLSKGITINQTAECTKCEKNRQLNDTWWQKSKPTADIVLIVSENIQLTKKHNPEHQLKKLIQELNKKISYEDMRVAIVGFGGKDVHEPAHVHTANGELFSQLKPSEVSKALKELEFEGKKTTNAMEAIRLAAQYPFRPEASKIFLLVTEEDKVQKNPQEIREVKKILAEQSITLSVFSSYKEIKTSKVDDIFGIKYNLDIISDKKVPKKHSISGLVKLPKGVYTELCTATKGSIFSVDLLLEGKQTMLKQVSEVVEEQIRSQIGTEKICKCYQGPAGEGVSKCRVVPVPFY
ncbi:uncharacterized protein [Branchiostoma lanceolatum]|uniref:uncharacterized protein n=1 Tax=Branchiostoma lanceolatum TaxID=7740 RepID=UPI003451F468